MKTICLWCIAVCLSISPLGVHAQERALEQTSTPIKVASGVMAGLALYQPKPNFPAKVVSGPIVLAVSIDKTGHVKDPKVVRSNSQELADAYVDAVKRWRYRPYLLNGEPVDVQTTITVQIQAGAATSGS
jgi:periplasmic protein TonB